MCSVMMDICVGIRCNDRCTDDGGVVVQCSYCVDRITNDIAC